MCLHVTMCHSSSFWYVCTFLMRGEAKQAVTILIPNWTTCTRFPPPHSWRPYSSSSTYLIHILSYLERKNTARLLLEHGYYWIWIQHDVQYLSTCMDDPQSYHPKQSISCTAIPHSFSFRRGIRSSCARVGMVSSADEESIAKRPTIAIQVSYICVV